jgi:hypothetical protein
MDARLVELCFGTPEVPDDVDLADEGSVVDHFIAAMGGDGPDDDPDPEFRPYADTRAAVRAIVTNQILGAEPFEPAVSAAERLLDAGYDRDATLRQLCGAMLRALQATMPDMRTGMPTMPGEDDEVALANLLPIDMPLNEMYAELPVPTAEELREVMLTIVRREPGVSVDDLVRVATIELGHADRSIVRDMADRTITSLMDTGMTMLTPDRCVDAAVLFGDHDPTGGDDPASRADVPVDPELVDLIRRCYEHEHDDGGLAIEVRSIAVAVELAKPGTWATPHAQFGDLLAAAGLEVRRGRVAGDDETWLYEFHMSLERELMGALGDEELELRALRALDDLFGAHADGAVPRLSRTMVDALRDPDIGPFLADVLAGSHADDEAFAAELDAVLGSLRDHASRDPERSLAVWLTSITLERRGEFAEAEQMVQEAARLDPDWGPAVERAGWYAFLRGDAVAARRAWAQAGWTLERERSLAERFGSGSAADLGRNDPCWCGSGRKYKTCHLGQPRTPDAAERAEWLWAKAVGFMTRSGDDAIGDLADLCSVRASNPSDPASIQAAFKDPIVLDTGLFEMGWFARFAAQAKSMLPDDEAALLDEWLPSQRDVFQVERIDGADVTLVRMGGDLEVTLGGGLPGRATTIGESWCLRPLRSGDRWFAPGGAIRLDGDEGDEANDVLDDPFGFCEWLAEVRPLR